jgi:glycosyltransferase involved in cell wall biosynthesis
MSREDKCMDKIAVLIPCYNEGRTIAKVVRDFQSALPEAVIYVYDNNSTDRSGEIAEEAGAAVRREYQQGKGNVIRRMFREIDAECYLITDGDDTYPAAAAAEMADKVISKKADMVVGDRLSSTYAGENKRRFHNFGNFLVRRSINVLFKNDIKDIMTGYRAFSYEFVKTFPVLSKGFEIETEMSIHAADKNMYIENVVIDYKDRPDGSVSKLDTYSDGLKVLRTILCLYRTYKPMGFFGWIALVLAALAVGFFIPVMSTFIKTGLVPNYPTLIVCGFTMIAAIQSFFTGLMLQTIVQKNRQDFEMELKKAAVWKTICVKEEKEQDALDPGFHANEGSHYNSSRYSRIL